MRIYVVVNRCLLKMFGYLSAWNPNFIQGLDWLELWPQLQQLLAIRRGRHHDPLVHLHHWPGAGFKNGVQERGTTAELLAVWCYSIHSLPLVLFTYHLWFTVLHYGRANRVHQIWHEPRIPSGRATFCSLQDCSWYGFLLRVYVCVSILSYYRFIRTGYSTWARSEASGGCTGTVDLEVKGGSYQSAKSGFYSIFMPLYPDFWAKCEIFPLGEVAGGPYLPPPHPHPSVPMYTDTVIKKNPW